ncbi:tRNA-splicing ligase RtcB homolog 1 [Rhizoctonia solani AG-1 IB]|uniref:3'-phosphate/5'-hydroxy nucleic acid ligase n=1 Tax=Thanatephorus cucumeris (strain AG1-IB / isolate 7/3/14) TaxID=1108050 RepID=M5BXU7_THACB|nr:tRNA-splicing ligase RtcB homolog 1 [Rhizoctonia solani AG-1 IB]
MPSNTRPLTIILNTNQSKRSIYLLPIDAPSQHALILAEARNKFRIKSLSQIYLKGGAVFSPDQALHPDAREVWISKGEPYVGKDAPAPGMVGANATGVEVRTDIIAEESYVDPEAVKQLKAVAGLEGVVAAIAAHGVYPALIGTDVGCGIALYRLAATPSRLAPSKIASRLRGLDDPWDGDVSAWLSERGVHKESEFDKASLGTIGAGNHFAEICVVEDIKDEGVSEQIGVRPGMVYLLVHTGSRGLGKSILQTHSQSNPNPFYPEGSPELSAYIDEHNYAVQWAVANRDLVAYRIASCLGLTLEEEAEDTQSRPIMPEKLIDVTHNSVTRHELLVDDQQTQEVWIHRKGAAPADRGVVPCPGSRGDFSWLLQPMGNGSDNAHSLAHGAGRLHPRSAATLRKNVPGTTTNLGSEVVCTDSTLMIEERPEAYKGIQAVVDDLEKRGCARGVVKLRPIVTYKMRNENARK